MKNNDKKIIKFSSYTTNKGQVILSLVIFFMFISLALSFGGIAPVIRDVKTTSGFINSTKGFFTAESGSEDVFYRFKNGMQVLSPETLSLNGATTTITVTDISSAEKELMSSGNSFGSMRKIKTNILVSSGAAFNYGVQIGAGGVELKNTSSIVGNLYSNGVIKGDDNNTITGDVISAGATGKIEEIQASGSAYANTIKKSNLGGNAYYQTINNTTVGGTSYPGSANQPSLSMPILDSLITGWEAGAEAGGVINTCPYTITTDTTLGPVKINCDLIISGNPTITLTGNVWVVGTIDIRNSPIIKISPSLGSTSVAMIADNPADRINSSTVELRNSAQFQGGGQVGSYVMMVSMNNRAETMQDDEEAIDVKNSVSGDLILYAPHGKVKVRDSVSVKEITAYMVTIKNNTNIVYESGLSNLLFSSGPSGSWTIKSWKEVE